MNLWNKLLGLCLILCFVTISMSIPTEGAMASGKIKKMVIAYSNTLSSESNKQWIASKFDVLDCTFTYASAVASIKKLNPNIKAIGYFDAMFADKSWSDWSLVTTHEDWFVHDINGKRIERNVYPGQFLMNPHSGWADYLAGRIHSYIDKYPYYDGVFLDDSGVDLKAADYTFKVPYSYFPKTVLQNWEAGLVHEVATIKEALGNKILLPNEWKYTSLAIPAGGTFWENFIHGRSSSYDRKPSTASALLSINILKEQAKLGRIISVNCGTKDSSLHPTATKQWQKFTLACFMFAVSDLSKAYYSWQFINTDSSKGYFPEMDIIFGSPVYDYKVLTKNTYIREFDHCYVVANLDPTYASIFTLKGIKYTLQPDNALFIQK